MDSPSGEFKIYKSKRLTTPRQMWSISN